MWQFHACLLSICLRHCEDAEAPPVCAADEMLDESWFTEQMDDEMQSAGVKPKKPW